MALKYMETQLEGEGVLDLLVLHVVKNSVI